MFFGLIFIAACTLNGVAYSQQYGTAPSNWKDLTGSKFAGAEDDLRGIRVRGMRINCDHRRRSCAVLWEPSGAVRTSPIDCSTKCNDGQWNKTENGLTAVPGSVKCESNCYREELSRYEIVFRVKNRQGKAVFTSAYVWDSNVRSRGDKHVDREGSLPSVQWGDVDLNYGEVEYWIKNITWSKFVPKKNDPDRVAFSLKDQMKPPEGKVAKRALVTFSKPRDFRTNGMLDGETSYYLLDRSAQLASIRPSSSYIKMATNRLVEQCAEGCMLVYAHGDGSDELMTEKCQKAAKLLKVEYCQERIFAADDCWPAKLACSQPFSKAVPDMVFTEGSTIPAMVRWSLQNRSKKFGYVSVTLGAEKFKLKPPDN